MKKCKNIILSHTDYINAVEQLALDQAEGTITQKQYNKKLAKLNAESEW